MSRGTKPLSYAATAGLAFAVVVIAGTVITSPPIFPDWVVFPLYLFTFVVFGLALLRARGREIDTSRPFTHLRPALLRILPVVLASMSVTAGVSFFQTGGQNPERDGDKYFLRNHNDLTPISRSEYLSAESASQRAFTAMAGIFLTLGLALSLAGLHSDAQTSGLPQYVRRQLK